MTCIAQKRLCLSSLFLLCCPRLSILDSFRFNDENEYEYEIKVKVLMRILKKDTLERFILLFSPKKLVGLFILKEVKPSTDGKMIKLLTFDDLFPPLRHLKLLVELRRLSRFARELSAGFLAAKKD